MRPRDVGIMYGKEFFANSADHLCIKQESNLKSLIVFLRAVKNLEMPFSLCLLGFTSVRIKPD